MVVLLACGALAAGAEGDARPPAGGGASQTPTPVETSPPDPAPSHATRLAPVYRPPHRGAPPTRVGGPMRGALALPTLLALAPPHVARTIAPAPSLFWHVDGVVATSQTLRFTLLDPRETQPVVEAKLPRPPAPGTQRVRLADYDVALVPGVEYEWSVALLADPGSEKTAHLARGFVLRIDPPIRSRSAGPVHQLAERGLWYDALAAAVDALERAPARADLRRERDALLRQVGLGVAARDATRTTPREP